MPDQLYSYDDSKNAGKSRVLEQRAIPGGWRLIFSLQPQSPGYCGIGLAFGKQATDVRDLSRLDAFEFQLVNPASRTVKVITRAHDPRITRATDPLSYRFSEARLAPRSSGPLVLPAKSFAIATWWLDMGYAPVSDTAKLFERMHAIEFQVVGIGEASKIDTLDILAPKLWLSAPLPWKMTIAFWLGALLPLVWWIRSRQRVPAQVLSAAEEPIALPKNVAQIETVPSPTPTPMRSESDLQRERLVHWLQNHYSDSALDADAVAKGCGIPKDRLASLLKEGYGMAFKPFLNELRLTEASRLLKETDRSISEIAFAVGYNSHTHFSRVFRERFQMTPGELRERTEETSVEAALPGTEGPMPNNPTDSTAKAVEESGRD